VTIGQHARTLAWNGPDPVRVEAASAVLGAESLTARGASITADYTVDWVLQTGPGWVTRRLSVRARGDGWARSLELGRAEGGIWSAVRRPAGQPAEPMDVFNSGDFQATIEFDGDGLVREYPGLASRLGGTSPAGRALH